MPRWYGTFPWGSPLMGKYVVIERDTAAAAQADLEHRFAGLEVRILTEAAAQAANWQGHTQLQRLGLTELTAQEEEQFHADHDTTDA